MKKMQKRILDAFYGEKELTEELKIILAIVKIVLLLGEYEFIKGTCGR